jgi:hypothetical protein
MKQLPFVRLTLPIVKRFQHSLAKSMNRNLKRIFDRLTLNLFGQNDERMTNSSQLYARIAAIYSTSRICEQDNQRQCYSLSPYLEQLMRNEKDYDRLVWAWKGWHDTCGNRIRSIYLEYIDLLTENARDNDYENLAVRQYRSNCSYFNRPCS